MAWFGDKTAYNRTETLDRAAKAHTRGNKKKAIAEYRKVLEHEPENAQILQKLGQLLAQTKQNAEAWKCFVAAAEGFKKQGFVDKQYGVYSTATTFMPREVELWETLARINVSRNRPADAVKVLLDGKKHFGGKKLRPFAIRLLQLASRIEPADFSTHYELAMLYRKSGDAAKARAVLETLAGRHRGSKLRRVRGALFRLGPTPGAAWRWLRAATRGR